MRKFLLVAALMAGAALSSFAQTSKKSDDGGKFSIGLEAGLPVGDASDAYNFVIGASFKYEHPVAQSLYVTGSIGYNAFLTKSALKDLGVKSSFGFIPLKAGLKYYIQNGFFAEGQLGVVFSTESGGGSAFAYAPGIGYSFDGGFEAGVRYEGWPKNGFTTSQIGLRLAYRFQ
jgi:hypothetical protein